MTTAYLGLDLHASSSTLGIMDDKGTYRGHQRFPTAESELIARLVAIQARKKILALEAGSLSRWAAQTACPYVDQVLVCDARQNRLISHNPHKSDAADAYNLCRLLRLGELHEVYHAAEDHRAVFKASALYYLDVRGQQVALKQKIKATFRRWGLLRVEGYSLYAADGRQAYLERLAQPVIIEQLRGLYQMLDTALATQKEAKAQMLRLSRRYAEIEEFTRVPGIGPIGACLFDAFIQTPERFKTKQKLWRYCGLGIRSRSSDGKPLGYQQLDPSGRSELKAVSYRAWLSALRSDNEVHAFFEGSLQRTADRTHARLNTQRKILAALWALWKHQRAYSPRRFLGSA